MNEHNMTPSQMVEGHRQLWLWLAANPGGSKYLWPGWDANGGEYPTSTISNSCFACQRDEDVGAERGGGSDPCCTYCPLLASAKRVVRERYGPGADTSGCLAGLYATHLGMYRFGELPIREANQLIADLDWEEVE